MEQPHSSDLEDVRVVAVCYNPQKRNACEDRCAHYIMAVILHGEGVFGPVESLDPWRLNPPCVCFIPPFVRQRNAPDHGSQWDYRPMVLDGPRVRAWIRYGWFPADSMHISLAHPERFVSVHQSLMQALHTGDRRLLDETKNELERALLTLHYDRIQADDVFSQSEERVHILHEIVRSWRAHPESEVDLRLTAADFHLSYHSFRRMFKEHYGVAPYEYLQRLRIEHASYMLLRKELLIKEVAYACGFTNLDSFRRTFRRIKKTSPSAYQRQLLGLVN